MGSAWRVCTALFSGMKGLSKSNREPVRGQPLESDADAKLELYGTPEKPASVGPSFRLKLAENFSSRRTKSAYESC